MTRVVVVGGGAAGMSAASAARRGRPAADVVVCEAGGFAAYGICGIPYLLGGVVPQAEDLLAYPPAEFRDKRGIDLRLRTRVSAIDVAARRVHTVSEGSAGAEDLPDRALVVDAQMRTSLPDVFAAGDCVALHHLVLGTPAWVPLGPAANKTGRVAGTVAAGGTASFSGVAGTAVVKVFDLEVARTGVTLTEARMSWSIDEWFVIALARTIRPSETVFHGFGSSRLGAAAAKVRGPADQWVSTARSRTPRPAARVTR